MRYVTLALWVLWTALTVTAAVLLCVQVDTWASAHARYVMSRPYYQCPIGRASVWNPTLVDQCR